MSDGGGVGTGPTLAENGRWPDQRSGHRHNRVLGRLRTSLFSRTRRRRPQPFRQRLRLNGEMQNLLSQPEPTRLPSEPEAEKAAAGVTDFASAQAVAAQFPSFSAAWARLAEFALEAN